MASVSRDSRRSNRKGPSSEQARAVTATVAATSRNSGVNSMAQTRRWRDCRYSSSALSKFTPVWIGT